MLTNFELAASTTSALPVSLLAESTAPTRVRRARMTNPRPTTRGAAALQPARHSAPEVRLELIASIRLRIAAGTYRISSMQLADCMMSAAYSA